MTVYIATLHDPVPDPPCPVCGGGGVDWNRNDGLVGPCPAHNGPGHRRGTEVSEEFAAQLLAYLRERKAGDLPDGATLRRWIELGRIAED